MYCQYQGGVSKVPPTAGLPLGGGSLLTGWARPELSGLSPRDKT